jgi:site-specific recombinase XerD
LFLHQVKVSRCTRMAEAGVDIKTMQQVMGHSDTKMILRIYDHVTENRAAEQMKKLDSMRSAAS